EIDFSVIDETSAGKYGRRSYIRDRTMPAQSLDTLVIVFSGDHKSGRRLFDGLIEANSASFWNKSLCAAISSLKYAGFVRPSTLFVSAPPRDIELIRSVYAKRMLKSPAGVMIASLGEMGSIKCVPQLHFVPLSDALCDAVASLNRSGRPATLSSVRETISQQCNQLEPPTKEMLKQTANALAKEGIVCMVGQHLFVTPAAPKTTVECQTGESMIIPEREEKRERKKEGIFARLFTRKNITSPCKGVIEKREKRSPLHPSLHQPSNILPDWEFNEGMDERVKEFRPSLYSTRPRSARHQKRREDRHQKRSQQYRNPSSDEDNYPHYPTTHYGPIDPPESIERYHMEKHQMTRRPAVVPSSVPIPSRARASTPTESSDSAYSRSVSEQSDNEVDHTYVNLRSAAEMEETQFEECTFWNGPATPIVTVM
ncbi:hypothetical protein PMAYCL1PPCAC_18535, partial [Pristionchus mayeri]